MRKKGKYSPEFKEQAVKRAISGSFTIKEVAESLGISYYVLRDWKKEYMKKLEESEIPKNPKQLKESEELKQLRKEVIKLREQNLILKKFAAMLSQENDLE
jgi:transposase